MKPATTTGGASYSQPTAKPPATAPASARPPCGDHDRPELGAVADREQVADDRRGQRGLDDAHARVRCHAVESLLVRAQREGADDADEDEQVRVDLGVRQLAVEAQTYRLRALRDLRQQVHDDVREADAGARAEDRAGPGATEQTRLRDDDACGRDRDRGDQRCAHSGIVPRT